MSVGKDFLHSHSGLERELKFPKHTVLVDERYGELFVDRAQFQYNGVIYYKVSTIEFANKGGVFKNLIK